MASLNELQGLGGFTQVPQYPYNNLIMNTPYDNYMGNKTMNTNRNPLNQFLKCRPLASKE